MSQLPVLNLQSLNQGLPAVTPAFGMAIAEASAICLTDEQTRASDPQGLPAYIIVIEFSRPLSIVQAKHNPQGTLGQ